METENISDFTVMNSLEGKGKSYYGIHFYPGVAQYQDSPKSEPYCVFLNEDTLRSMDRSFSGRPVYVEHVDDVEQNIDKLRGEVDGWVVKSFYNEIDGKHWVEFLVVSERGEAAVQRGMRLSNAYISKSEGSGGMWNGVPYQKEITSGEYEHLAIVGNPRYEESVIMTPDEFKQYNEKKVLELKKFSNSKGDEVMKLNFFKKQKVENTLDLESMSIVLPKSGKEMTLTQIVNAMDEKEADKNSGLADMSHKVKMHDGSYCNVGELMEKHKAMMDELEDIKAKNASETEVETKKESVDVANDDDDVDAPMENAEDEEKKKENEDEEIKEEKKKNAIAKAKALKNAHLNAVPKMDRPTVDLASDRLSRGRQLYG